MKTRTKALLLSLCVVALTVATAFGTYAYLTDNDSATNTFTVGSVGITLDEAKVNTNGTYVTDKDNRTDKNTYHLIPGHSYIKDPTVHVADNSESAWLFVKVDNQIAAIESKEAGYVTIAKQIENNGWKTLDGVTGVYYCQYDKDATPAKVDFVVFNNFAVDGDSVTKEILAKYKGAMVTITAYAIQLPGFEDKPVDAWKALQTQLAANP